MNKKIILNDLYDLDPLTYEDAYHEICSDLDEYKELLLSEIKRNDLTFENRGRVIELLGHYKDRSFENIFVEELYKMEDEIIPWALSALETLNTDSSLEVVTKFKKDHPKWD